MLEVLENLFASGGFIPHGHCYLWKPELVWLHIVSDSLIAIAYYSIPITLVYFVRKRADLPFNWIFLLFGAFIVACGTTHVLEIWTLWHPTYWLSGLLKAITAIISLYTAVKLVPLVPKALDLPSPTQLEKALSKLEHEITERKRTERTLELQGVIVRNMAEGICLVRATDSLIVYANPKFESMFGYGSGELNEKPVAVINYASDEQSAAQVGNEIMHQINQHGQATYEIHNVKKDGTAFWCRANSSTFEHPEYGTVYVAVHEDITIRKQAEEAIKQAKEAAEAANRAKSEFMANMSHEFRTPLNGILGYAHILKREKNLTSKQQDGLGIIQQCGEHLLTLINDILDLSKIEARKMEIYRSDFRFPEFLNNLADIFRIRAEQKNISFSYESLSLLPTLVRGDEQKLRQVLINLLVNAIKFTETGRVSFKVGYVKSFEFSGFSSQLNSEIQNSKLKTQNSSKIRFQVEDTGIGVPSENLTEIFLPFHQVENNRHWVEGTGLGLAISQKLAQLMGSTLEVKSQLGSGSVFWIDVDLPEVSESSEVAKHQERNIIGFKGEKRKVLVVDDKWENRSVLVNLLEPLGFEIVEATDGRDCLNKVLEFKPDVVLMDLVMPVIDGFEATRQIRKLAAVKKIVIIATSASVFDYSQYKSRKAGCDDFIPKPVRIEHLLERLRVHLGLEWVYNDSEFSKAADSEIGVVDQDLEGVASNQQPNNLNSQLPTPKLMAPPPEEIALLLDLAMRGNVKGILEKAAILEQLDDEFMPFASELRQLAKGFQLKQIREFLQPYTLDRE